MQIGHELRAMDHDRDLRSWAPQNAYKEWTSELTSWRRLLTIVTRIVSGPELERLIDLARDALDPDRDASVPAVMTHITIVMMGRDKWIWAIFFHSFGVEALHLMMDTLALIKLKMYLMEILVQLN